MEWPDRLEVVIEVPRGGFIKRRDDGGIDFVSPVPCPFNYGSVPGTRSGDGDRLDAVVLGTRLARGSRVSMAVVGCVHFVDAGDADPKFICGNQALSRVDRLSLLGFFAVYARAKRLLNGVRRKPGPTHCAGLEERTPRGLGVR